MTGRRSCSVLTLSGIGLNLAAGVALAQTRSSGMCGSRPMVRSAGSAGMPYARSLGFGYRGYSMPYFATPTYASMYYPMYSMPYLTMAARASTLSTDPARAEESTPAKEQTSVLTALELPTTKDGHLDWPLALAALPGEKPRELQKQVETLVLQMASKPKDAANSQFAEEAKSVLKGFRSQMEANRFSITRGCRKDAERFLDQLDRTLTSLQPATPELARR